MNLTVTDLPIAEITVNGRSRHDLGDVTALSASIATLGLLHPVIVAEDHSLIVGQRRLAACQALGWKTIPARVIDLDDPLAAEHDENVLRKPFTPVEAVHIGEAIREREREKAKERQKEHGKTAPGKKKDTSGNFPEVSEPQSRDIAGASVGMSGKTYMKAKAVVDAAALDPDNYGHLVEAMGRTGKIDPYY